MCESCAHGKLITEAMDTDHMFKVKVEHKKRRAL